MSTATPENKNPFPGLRPFREDEEYLFFGRENQVDAMVDKLAATHFLGVVGSSGSGKSSLVNCGLRPALHGGLMARAGTSWRMAQFRPGNDPMRAMARALAEDGVLFKGYQAGGLTLAEIVDTTLRMSKLGLVDIYEQANLSKDVNLLVVVDQFEELFRYRQPGAGQQQNVTGAIEEATAFVNLLLAAKEQTTHPIYIVLTMRSDFLGDCTQFSGLAEAINTGQYLVPRMTRDERRAAISGPVGVGGAEISPVLLTRLVNDVGDNPDQLSILQHALNRTWAKWEASGDTGPLDLPHYELIGTMTRALDQHAEKAYAELTTPRQRQICEKLFKALTDKATDPRGVRRPTRLDTLCALVEATPEEITQVIDVFRKPSRSFLMPPADETLEAKTVIDISHESLMRVWERLKSWTDQEALSAHMYCRLAETAVLHGEGKAGLWDDPDLQGAVDWHENNRPNKDWAQQYDPGFDGAMAFLQKSKEARDAEVAEVEFSHKMRTVRNVIVGLVLLLWLWDPLKLAAPVPVTYKVTDEVKKNLEQANILTLPEEITDELSDPRQSLIWNNASDETRKEALDKALSEGQNKEQIAAALKVRLVRVPEVQRRSLLNEPLPKERQVYTRYDNPSSKNLKQLKKTDVAIVPLPESEYFEPLEDVYFVPDSVKVAADDQTGLVAIALNTRLRESLLKRPEQLQLAAETFRLLLHLFLYLGLVFAVGGIYRWFAFGVGQAGESVLAASPSWFRWRRFQVRVQKFLDRSQSPRAKFILSVSLLLAGVVLVGFGLFTFLRDPESVLRYGVPIGLILILLVPTDGILKGAWAPRFKKAQGALLQLGSLYALVGLLLLFYWTEDWGPSLLLIQKRPVLALAAIGLLLLGKRKYELTAEESLALHPKRAPVLHLRSFDSEKQNRKQTFISWLKRFVWPNDEQLLRPIFGAMGPFAAFTNIEELAQAGTVATAGAIPGDSLSPATELLRRSALVILQVDNRLTQGFLSQIRQTIETLKPNQVLVYFSQNIEATKLNEVYQKFVNQTRDVFSSVLPPSIDSSRFLAFDDDWQPFFCRSVTMSKFSLGRLMPLLGHRLEAARRSRAFARALRPFFERRNLLNSERKLYGDRAIGVSAFVLFDLGLPAGVMMLRNLWITRRRWVALIALFAPPIFILVSIFVGYILVWILSNLDVQLENVQLETTVFLIMIVFGSPITTYWLWRRLSGREIRQHIALGGDTQPLWKVILVLLLTGGLMLGFFVYLLLISV
jgi:energy-coupling factor transporter ATP-binding protein EcfA2